MNLLTDPLILPEPWTLDASCSQTNPDLFFPEPQDNATADKAKRVCAKCPVINQCREYAARTGQRDGIWAGVTARSVKRSMKGARNMTMNLAPGAVPATYAHEQAECARCPKCHPGRAYSASFCRVSSCTCHRRTA